MSSYPKWLYHATEPARIVKDADAHKALGPGWEETPAAFANGAAKVEPKPAAPVGVLAEATGGGASTLPKPTKKVK